MSAPLISVIIPIYNVEPYVRQALDSVVNQTYRNLEIILIDDGSPDRCGEICDEYARRDPRVRVIHQKNAGVSAARNAGIDSATGDWLAFVDPDDWLEAEAYELALARANETAVDMVFFDCDAVYEDHSVKLSNIDAAQDTVFRDLNEKEAFCAYMKMGGIWSCLIRTVCVKGKIYFCRDLTNYEDYLFRTACYSQINAYAYMKRTFYHYRMRGGSATHREGGVALIQNSLRHLYKEIREYDARYPNRYPENYRTITNSLLLRAVSNMIALLPYETDKEEALEAICAYVNTEEVQETLNDYDVRMLGRIPRLLVRFKRIDESTIRFVSRLVSIKNAVCAIFHKLSGIMKR